MRTCRKAVWAINHSKSDVYWWLLFYTYIFALHYLARNSKQTKSLFSIHHINYKWRLCRTVWVSEARQFISISNQFSCMVIPLYFLYTNWLETDNFTGGIFHFSIIKKSFIQSLRRIPFHFEDDIDMFMWIFKRKKLFVRCRKAEKDWKGCQYVHKVISL